MADRTAVPGLTLLLLLAQLGCDGGSAAARPAGGQVRRIASLHDVTTEIVVALGGTGALVGVQEPVDTDAATAAAIAGVTRVSGLESLIVARPELVVGLATVGEQSPELVAALRDRGIEVYLADPRTLEDVHAMVRLLAGRLGREAAGSALLDRLAGAEGPAVAIADDARPRVFVFDCCDPPFTAGGATVLSDLIERAGGRNLFADLEADWTHVSWEEVVARRPALVVIHAYDMEGQGDVAGKRAALRRVPGLERVPVVTMPLGFSLGGLRSVDGLVRLREALAP
jgi:iron complex transport system substrate-binding protein